MSWEVQKVREEEEDIMLPVGGRIRDKLPKEAFINLSNFPDEFTLSQTAGLMCGFFAP